MSDQQQMPDIGALLEQAQALQEQLIEARESAASQVLTGQAGNGAVAVQVTGGLEFQKVHIDPAVLDDAEMLEDLVLAALRDAVEKVNELNESAMGAITGETEV